MRQVLLREPRRVEVADRELRSSPEQALVRLRWAGICGSDLAAYRGRSPMVRYPLVLGHELLVDVVEAPGRPELVGLRAVVDPLLPCRVCRVCRAGRPNCCPQLRLLGVHVDGGLGELTPVRVDQLHPVPDDLPDSVAVL